MPGLAELAFDDVEGEQLLPTWSVGDRLRLRFSAAVNVKPGWPLAGGRSFVDATFGFSSNLGDDYSVCGAHLKPLPWCILASPPLTRTRGRLAGRMVGRLYFSNHGALIRIEARSKARI